MRAFTLLPFVALLFSVLFLGGCDTVSPTTEVDLHLEGAVTDAATGAAVSGAVVRLYVLNEDITSRVLASTTTGADGRYTLNHRLTDVATEEELGGECAIWNDDVTASVSLTTLAGGYRDGFVWASVSVACVETPQTIDFALAPVN